MTTPLTIVHTSDWHLGHELHSHSREAEHDAFLAWLLDRLEETGTAVVHLLDWRQRDVADVFAGVLPAPGGPFRKGPWEQTAWGPRLADAPTWAGVRLEREGRAAPRELGWSVLVDVVVEHLEVGADGEPLVHRRGRYQRPGADGPAASGGS